MSALALFYFAVTVGVVIEYSVPSRKTWQLLGMMLFWPVGLGLAIGAAIRREIYKRAPSRPGL